MRYIGVTLGMLLLLAPAPACSTPQSNTYCYETAPRTPKPTANAVEVLDSSKVRRPYRVIGFVKTEAAKTRDTAEIVARLQNEARQLGGDALLDLSHGPADGAAPSPVFSHLKSGGALPQECLSYFEYGSSQEVWAARVIVWQ